MWRRRMLPLGGAGKRSAAYALRPLARNDLVRVFRYVLDFRGGWQPPPHLREDRTGVGHHSMCRLL